MAFCEAMTGVAFARSMSPNVREAIRKQRQSIEVATALLERIEELRGSPITKAEAVRYRISLAAFAWQLRSGTGKDISSLREAGFYRNVDYNDIATRDHMDEVVLAMRRALI